MEKKCGPEGWVFVKTVCHQCGDEVDRILKVKKTRAHLCSLQCELRYWLEIFN